MRLLTGLPPGSSLEVGCGAGTLAYELEQKGFECQALETSNRARDMARYVNRTSKTFKVFEEPQESWARAFDYILSFEVLEHIDDDKGALTNWANWLVPGGYLLLSAPAHQRRWAIDDEVVGHFRRYERKELENLLQSANFEILDFQCWGFPLSNLIRPLRLKNMKKSGRQSPKKPLLMKSPPQAAI